ncbi:uncharacterized protein LOC127182803 [Labeo rohita]|nr:uncharacterized protein LOC127182803 [Labeo rohita]
MTKITGQMLSSPVLSPISSALFPLIQGVGYNYAQLYSKDTVVQPSSDRSAMQHLVENPLIKDSDAPETSKHLAEPTMCPYFFRKLESTASPQPNTKPDNVAPVVPPSKLNSRPLQNRPVAEPLAYSDQSLDPAINQAKMQQYFSPWGHDMQSMVVAPNNVPSFEKLVQHDITSKPTIPPTLGKNAFMNYWYQAANLNAKPPMSDSPTQDSFTQMPSTNHNPFEPINESPQPAQTRGKNPPLQLSFHPLMQIRNSVPVMNPQLYVPPNGESVVPVFRDPKLFDTHWVPAFQSNKDALLSSSQSNGYIRRPSTVD